MKKLYRSIILLCVLFVPHFAFSTHIVGGSIHYEQLGVSTYRIIVKVYRDCGTGQAPFDMPLTLDVRNGDGTASGKNITFTSADSVLVPSYLDSCVASSPVCVKEAIYSKIVTNLTPGTGGYHIFYQRCCRNWSIQNIVTPNDDGASFYTYIPDNNVAGYNSSPKWVNFPPIYVCQGMPINFDHAATDPDGDSLVYKFYRPFLGCSSGGGFNIGPNCANNYPTFPGNVANFPTITWLNASFNDNTPLGGSPLTISSTGLLNGSPPNVGQYVVGIKCEEYRNGQLLSYIIRDFQFNVVNCPPPAIAGIGPVQGCSGTSITFSNTSTPNATTFFWDFGNTASTTDTSYKKNPPAYNYPGPGTYTVILITQYGTKCADTATQVVNISTATAAFTQPPTTCAGSIITFTNTSSSSSNTTITNYTWTFPGGSPASSNSQNPAVTYTAGGVYTTTLTVRNGFGCTSTTSRTFTIQARPTVNAGSDLTRCKNNPLANLNGSVTGASGGTWISPGGSFTPSANVLNPSYNPSLGVVQSGSATLILTTTGNGVCPAARDTVRINYTPEPTANAGNDTAVCKNSPPIQLNGSVTVATGGAWTTTGCGTFSPSALALNAIYTPCGADTANGSVKLILSTTGNGNCNVVKDTINITFTPAPKVYISANDTACLGQGIPLSVSVGTGQGTWSTSGTGTFSPNNTSLNPVYFPSSSDSSNGTVTLRFISGNNGGCFPEEDSVVIRLLPQPLVNFSYVESCVYTPVQFTDLSTGFISINKWLWKFGDGGTSTVKNPSHPYNPGTYTVTLIATTNLGCVDSVKKTITVHPQPVANFSANPLCVIDSVEFTDLSTISPPDNIVSWYWNFGDPASGSSDTSTRQNPKHKFLSGPGSYTISLIVSSSFGCKDTITRTLDIFPAPVATFSHTPNTCNNSTIVFRDMSTIGTGGAIGSWTWTFGDGGSSNQQHPSHQYVNPGTYTVTLIVSSTDGCRDTISQPIIIYPLPVANFTHSSLCAVDSVWFTDLSTIPSGTVSAWTWMFGDGGTSNTKNPSHLYPSEGTYTVSLIVRSSPGGCLDTVAKVINLKAKPVANFSSNSVCQNTAIPFTDLSTIRLGGTITSWNWNFGDPSSPNNTSTLRNPTHLFTGTGTFTVTLIVSNGFCFDTITKPVNITGINPDFAYTGGCLGSGTMFRDSSQVIPAGSIVWWKWIYGDGGQDTAIKNPTHTYATTGNYTVTLIVRSNQGCYDTIKKAINVMPLPVANFSIGKSPSLVLEPVRFTDLSKTNIVWWSWDFGDMNTSGTQHPSHAYEKGGTYKVKLVVRDASGCLDSTYRDVLIVHPPNIPNVFSPNGDGNNDVLRILGGPYKQLDFKIYNNWGELIFVSSSQSEGWNGTRENIPQPVGVYVYIVTATTEDNKQYNLTGDVTLLR